MSDPFTAAVAAIVAGADPEIEARALHDRLTSAERLSLLDGDEPFYAGMAALMAQRYNERPFVMGAIERLGIPGIRFVDGPRGCAAGTATAFPAAMTRGATWDVALEEEVGGVIGREVRHPAWGRAQESYGDEPYHLGEMGAALHRGVASNAMTCVKHFALNSMENARFKVDVEASEAVLHDMYLPHFRRVVDAGADAVMSAYNSVNGEWAGQNPYLLTRVLRDDWRFGGFVISDFIVGFRDAAASLNAGLDLEAPFAQQRAIHLPRQLAEGTTDQTAVTRAGVRLIAAQLRFAARARDAVPVEMADASARKLARTVAARGMVLLKNEPIGGTPVLPIPPGTISRIAVIGRLADGDNMGDHGSSQVTPPYSISPVEGIRARYAGADVASVTADDPDAAALAAANADMAVVVVGYNWRDEGEFIGGSEMTSDPALLALYPPPPPDIAERLAAARSGASDKAMMSVKGGDRVSLRLRPVDEAIIRAVAAANPRTIVVIVAAGAVITEGWRGAVPAMLLMGYAGMEGGHALADILSGAANPSGRLPYAIPRSEDDLPFFDRDARHVTYDRLHGQRLLDARGATAAFPHGFGLSYTHFAIRSARIVAADAESVTIRATVANTGARDGHHVVQAYGRRQQQPYAHEAILMGFAAVAVPAGTAIEIELRCPLLPLAAWDRGLGRVVPAPSAVSIEIGSHAADPEATRLIPSA